jgi:hypothetical protein
MPLSCKCGDWEGEGSGYWKPEAFTTLGTKRSRRCKSCKEKISPGDQCLEFQRFHYPADDVEIRIWGDNGEVEIPDSSWFLCESCGEIYINLEDLGFCVAPDENMDDLLSEYRAEFIKDNGLYPGDVRMV